MISFTNLEAGAGNLSSRKRQLVQPNHSRFRILEGQFRRHLIDRQTYRERRSAALVEWPNLAS